MDLKPAGGFPRILLLTSLVLIGSACRPDREAEPVVIALSSPTGFVTGRAVLAGVEVALEEFGGEVQGRPVRLRIFDVADPQQPHRVSDEAEIRAAQEAATDPAVLGYIGPLFSSQAKLSIPILNRAGIPQISPTASWPGLTRAGFEPGEPGIYYPTGRHTFFRVIPNDERQVVALADWAYGMGYRRYSILEGESPYSRGMAGIFRERVHDFGAEIVGHHHLQHAPLREEDFQPYIEKVVASRPEAVLFSADFQGEGNIDGFRILQAMGEHLPELAVLAPETLSNQVLLDRTGGVFQNHVYGVSGSIPPDQMETPKALVFRNRFEELHGEPPRSLGVLAYEATMVLLEAMEAAPALTRPEILQSVRQLGTPQGALTDWRLDAAGDRFGIGVGGYEVIDGEWQFVKILDGTSTFPGE